MGKTLHNNYILDVFNNFFFLNIFIKIIFSRKTTFQLSKKVIFLVLSNVIFLQKHFSSEKHLLKTM